MPVQETRTMSEPIRKKKKKGQPRPLPPDVTARNLAIEKQRREVLNENFLVCI
jgi:hypothetical protein